MIQDIGLGRYHVEYEIHEPSDNDFVWAFKVREVFLKKDENGTVFPRVKDLKGKGRLQYLFRIEGISHFLWWFDQEEPELPGFMFTSTQALRDPSLPDEAFAGMTAYHLFVWYRDNCYCGRCGKKAEIYDRERAMRCLNCGNIIYPKICPAVIVGIRNGNKLLMTRYANRPFRGRALVAGFCEIGEAGEDTVRREVMEEVGLKVTNIRYFGSQPWGSETDLLLGYFCDVEGDDTIVRDAGELAIAEWIEREDIEPQKNTLALTATMIETFRKGFD